jgi:hypothetical protein
MSNLPQTRLKHNSVNAELQYFAQDLAQIHSDKGVIPQVYEQIALMPGFAELFTSYFLRTDPIVVSSDLMKQFSNSIDLFRQLKKDEGTRQTYIGLGSQNSEIDSVFRRSRHSNTDLKSRREEYVGYGATLNFEIPPITNYDFLNSIRKTPVIILGGGVSGVMVYRALVDQGWSEDSITIVEKSEKIGGIWTYDNVSGLTRNNPRDMKFLESTLHKAPGDGSEITRFVNDLASQTNIRTKKVKGKVNKIIPKDLNTIVECESAGQKISIEAPIVVNTLGLGKPKAANNPQKMTTDVQNCGGRWQIKIDEATAKSLSGKDIVLVGLGNSTAEMIEQISNWNRQGYQISYKIITHYPADSVYQPSRTVSQRNKNWRIYRDLTLPTLVDYVGDLERERRAYEVALTGGNIISDVVHWTMSDNRLIVKTRDDKIKKIPCDRLFTLIGYKHDPSTLHEMGIQTNAESDPLYDYDGEFIQDPTSTGRSRLCPGYFGFGAILNSEHNPNSIVIPGMIHRINDLMQGIFLRSAEYQMKTKK